MKKNEKNITLIINRGLRDGFAEYTLNKTEFLQKISKFLKEPRKVFLGMGDFLELGDYNNLIDAILLDNQFAQLEAILDKNNRKIAESGEIPFSFFKLAVYFPEFILKETHVDLISIIGQKGRLFPGAMEFIDFARKYDPLVLTAIPYEISIEYIKRLGLSSENLYSTEYNKYKEKPSFFSGGISRFVSGNRRIIEIEKKMSEMNYTFEDVIYIGHGEAGSNTFSNFNSIAFNPPEPIMDRSRFNIYGSTLESIAVLFNFDESMNRYLLSPEFEDSFPSLLVYSEVREKSDSLIRVELEHRRMQENTIGMKIEHSQDSYASLEREIDVLLGASTVNLSEARSIIHSRLQKYIDDPNSLVKDVYNIAKERYKNFCTV